MAVTFIKDGKSTKVGNIVVNGSGGGGGGTAEVKVDGITIVQNEDGTISAKTPNIPMTGAGSIWYDE